MTMRVPILFYAGLISLLSIFTLGFQVLKLKPQTPFKPAEFVTISLPEGKIEVAKFETSIAEWLACVGDGACPDLGIDMSIKDFPVTGVNLEDIDKYIEWYSKRSGELVDLPSMEEWSFIAGNHGSTRKQKLFDDPRMAWATNYDMTKQVGDVPLKSRGSYGVNNHGIYDIKGGVWEWSKTCVPNIFKQSTSYNACVAGRAAMGEHLAILYDQLRDPGKAGCSAGQPPAYVGFRIIKRNPA